MLTPRPLPLLQQKWAGAAASGSTRVLWRSRSASWSSTELWIIGHAMGAGEESGGWRCLTVGASNPLASAQGGVGCSGGQFFLTGARMWKWSWGRRGLRRLASGCLSSMSRRVGTAITCDGLRSGSISLKMRRRRTCWCLLHPPVMGMSPVNGGSGLSGMGCWIRWSNEGESGAHLLWGSHFFFPFNRACLGFWSFDLGSWNLDLRFLKWLDLWDLWSSDLSGLRGLAWVLGGKFSKATNLPSK